MRIWWVCASEHSEGGWHWGNFFSHPRSGRGWGGPEWIRSPLSHAHIRRMRIGDVVIAYQAKAGVCGLARLASDGYQTRTGGPYDVLDLAPRPIVALNQPVPIQVIKQLPNAASSFEFIRVLRGTVFKVKPIGLSRLIGLMLAFNPTQARQIRSFVSRVKLDVPYRIK